MEGLSRQMDTANLSVSSNSDGIVFCCLSSSSWSTNVRGAAALPRQQRARAQIKKRAAAAAGARESVVAPATVGICCGFIGFNFTPLLS